MTIDKPHAVELSRRDVLLEVAADLFLHNSYDTVTVDMVCAKAGISGPGLYRHFQNKQALLIAVVEKGLGSLHQFAAETVESEPDPRAALERMVDFHLRSVITSPPTPLIFMKNEHAFPAAEHRRIRREMNRYAEEWISVLAQLRPDLAEPEVRLLTHSVFSMLNAVASLNKGLDKESIIHTMSRAAINALTLP
ncbi:TetR/AcrR family transcriptional regulator [Tsukamurella tyrosinosolvens]|uniref:TetR/AcrR family transcriptional regulator n=1 Tax=Tsukamurella tyrosinosolvens TaxID=57704 RepID=UPI000C7F7106|nr:TetR/AcrR family transcriptional regulator [Tsukamurella tyrosinosolvens]AUN41821.1 TetR family transcriptional regulator [Tsukamurella tyrosinosolvens]